MFLLKSYQQDTVDALVKYTAEAFCMSGRQIPILLKAPTGAGKTVTMAAYLATLISEAGIRPDIPRDIAIIWLAPNTLHLQSYAALRGFYSELHTLKTLQLSDVSPGDGLNSYELLFVNWSSVDKEKNTFRRDNEIGYNLDELINNTKAAGVEIIAVIDEAHLSAFTGAQAIAVRKLIDAKIEISVTATPNVHPDMQVRMSRRDVIEAGMIKKSVLLNTDLSEAEQRGTDMPLYLLRKAMTKRRELKEAYEAARLDINPLLLIQLPSENATLTAEDRAMRTMLENYLAGEFDVKETNGRLAVWLSDNKDKQNLEGIERPNAPQQVLLFKQAISQGWDCPRAAVLLIFREIGSNTFGVQTVGRILRMPEQKHYADERLNHGYVYTNIESNSIRVIPDDQDYFSLHIARKREDVVTHPMRATFIVNDRPTAGYLLSDFMRIFYSVVEKEYGVKEIPEATLFNQDETELIEERKKANRSLFAESWNLNLAEIEIHIPTDITVDALDVGSIDVGADHIADFAKTSEELSALLDRYCYQSITVLNKSKSWKLLRRTLIQFVEYYMGYDELDARKILLEKNNNLLLTQLIIKTLEHYDQWQRARGNINKRKEEFAWDVPDERAYSEYYRKDAVKEHHALLPFYQAGNVSNPEKAFATLLDASTPHIEWWYKNGDSGKEHFSIPYHNCNGVLSLFYPDFIIQFRSGTLGIFDTKTKDSDSEAANKYAGLMEYLREEAKREPEKKKAGGILLAEGEPVQFRYYEGDGKNLAEPETQFFNVHLH